MNANTLIRTNTNRIAALVLAGFVGMSCAAYAQPMQGDDSTAHQRAVASQRRHDHRHHTGAKIVGGSAMGGAVIGGLAGGGKGALVGGALGAGGGAIANHVRVKKGQKARERRDQ